MSISTDYTNQVLFTKKTIGMTKNGWCRTNYHGDGKRRFGNLTNGLCLECQLKSMMLIRSQTADQIIQLQEKIIDLETKRDRLNSKIDYLRFKLHTFVTEEKS